MAVNNIIPLLSPMAMSFYFCFECPEWIEPLVNRFWIETVCHVQADRWEVNEILIFFSSLMVFFSHMKFKRERPVLPI